MGLFHRKSRIKLDINNTSFHEEEKGTNRSIDINLLNQKWWKTATPNNVVAEIEKGADVNAVFYDEDGIKTKTNPLTIAVNDAIQKLSLAEVNNMFKVTSENNGNTENYVNNIRILIKNGADVNTIEGITLYELCWDKYLGILNILIENGLDVNKGISFLFTDSEKLIKIAAQNGQKQIVDRLLEAGAEDTRTLMEKMKTLFC